MGTRDEVAQEVSWGGRGGFFTVREEDISRSMLAEIRIGREEEGIAEEAPAGRLGRSGAVGSGFGR